MGFIDIDTCPQCTSGNTDSYLHATWYCQPVHSVWTTVIETISTILECRVPLSPTLCLLGDTSEFPLLSQHKIPVLVSLAITKKIVFQNWLSKTSCHLKHWSNLLPEYISTEEIHARKNNNICAFKDIWNPFITFLQIQP